MGKVGPPHPCPALPPLESSPSPYLLEGGLPPAPTRFWPLEASVCSSLARPWDFFRDKAWLSQSSSSLSLDTPSWEGWLALAGKPALSVGGFGPKEEEGSPAGAEHRPESECWLLGGSTEGVESAEPPL